MNLLTKSRWIARASILAMASAALLNGAEARKVRQPAVAGSFYPADPAELGKMVDRFLARAAVPALPDVLALIAPHAGYSYSGPVAGYSYAVLKGRKVERVVAIAPSHSDSFPFAAVYDGAAYATPLGEIPVDGGFAAKLAGMSPLIRLSGRGHESSGGRGEHALEVQLPFLQRVLGPFQLVPVIMGEQSYQTSRTLGLALARAIQAPGTLIVASSDLSHYHPYDEAVKLDRKTLKAVEEWDYLSMSQNFARNIWEACGGGPIVAAMIAAERLGADQAKVLKYANSGDTSGERSRVVGYGAVALVKGAGRRGATEARFTLNALEKEDLIRIARKSVETAVREHKSYECSAGASAALAQERGAFVTLKKNGELRGCIGFIAPMKPLFLTVRDAAVAAALEDDRFSPVKAAELAALEFEISVLSPFRRVLDIRQIQVGRHGLVVRKGEHEGLLLPQVAREQGWDRMTFLDQTCIKAGLPARAWQDEETDIFSFTAMVIGERKPLEPLIPEEIRLPQPSGRQGVPGPGLPPPSAGLF